MKELEIRQILLQLLQDHIFEEDPGEQYMGGDNKPTRADEGKWTAEHLPATMRFCSVVFQRTCAARLVKEAKHGVSPVPSRASSPAPGSSNSVLKSVPEKRVRTESV